MTLDHTFARFDQALHWNAALYVGYKTIFIVLSLTLFARLSANDYALWANVNSIIFLFLLWLDCGMRKSVPRFFPEFSSSRHFMIGVIAVQLGILLISTPCIYYMLSYTAHTLAPHGSSSICYLGIVIFLTQGVINSLRLFFHSYFLHKYFNFLAIIIMVIEMLCNLSLLYFTAEQSTLIATLWINKIIADVTLIIISIFLLIRLLPTIAQQAIIKTETAEIPKPTHAQKDIPKKFILHSFVMWMAMVIKSFTERNFLVPFITQAISPEMANIFKVSNDIALALYRFILKTIGTADTSLLTYSNMLNKKDELSTAFTKLITKITMLCLPLVGILGVMNMYKTYFFDNHATFQLFIIMAMCYLIETLLLPFERMLEIKKNYYYLLIGYAPYVIGTLFLLTNTTIITSIGMLPFIVMIHGIRLASSFLLVFLSYKAYDIRFPFTAIAQRYGFIK